MGELEIKELKYRVVTLEQAVRVLLKSIGSLEIMVEERTLSEAMVEAVREAYQPLVQMLGIDSNMAPRLRILDGKTSPTILGPITATHLLALIRRTSSSISFSLPKSSFVVSFG